MLCTISMYIQPVNDNAGNGIKVLDGAEIITPPPACPRCSPSSPPLPTPFSNSKTVKAKDLPS